MANKNTRTQNNEDTANVEENSNNVDPNNNFPVEQAQEERDQLNEARNNPDVELNGMSPASGRPSNVGSVENQTEDTSND